MVINIPTFTILFCFVYRTIHHDNFVTGFDLTPPYRPSRNHRPEHRFEREGYNVGGAYEPEEHYGDGWYYYPPPPPPPHRVHYHNHHPYDFHGHDYEEFDDDLPSHPRYEQQKYVPPYVQQKEQQQQHHHLYESTFGQPMTAVRSSSSTMEDEDVDERTNRSQIKSIWKTSAPVLVQSSALKTFSFEAATVERVQVLLKRGRRHGPNNRYPQNPIQAQIDLWHGPDCTPQNLAIYIEDVDDDDDEYDDEDVDLIFGHNGDRRINNVEGEDDEWQNKDDDTTNFSAIIETPQGHNTIAIRNAASNFDLLACVEGEEMNDPNSGHPRGSPAEYYNDPYGKPYSNPAASVNHKDPNASNSSPLQSVIERLMATSTPQLVEGCGTKGEKKGESTRSDVHTVPLASNVASVQVLLRTDYTRPLQARVELILQENSPKNKKSSGRVLKRTIVEVYSEDGMERPFFAVLETPKKRNRRRRSNNGPRKRNNKTYSVSMRVVNLSGPEFPLLSSVEPYVIDTNMPDDDDDPPSVVGENINEECNGIGGGDDETDHIIGCNDGDDDDKDEEESAWWESLEDSHFGGGSHYDMGKNSTILDAEIL
jgi:hypothetical protein